MGYRPANDSSVQGAGLGRARTQESIPSGFISKTAWISVVVCAVLLGAYLTGLIDAGDRLLEDQRSRWVRHNATGNVVIVSIDSDSLEEIGVWPWPRRVHAGVLENLIEAGASQVAFDIDFSQESEPQSDQILADALDSASGSVILPAFLQWRTDTVASEVVLTRPIKILRDRAWEGLVNVGVDASGFVRTIRTGTVYGNDFVPSMAALLAGEGFPSDRNLRINYGIQPDTIPRISFADVFYGRVDPERLTGKTVIVGASAIELGDHFTVPVYGILSGPVIQALGVEALVQNLVLAPRSPAIWYLAMAGFVLFLAFFLPRLKFARELLLLGAIAPCVEFMAFAVQANLSVSLPTFTVHLAIAASLAIAVGRELNRRKLVGILALARSQNHERLLERILNDSFDGILIADSNSRLLVINPSGQNILFGETKTDIVGKKLSDFLPEEISSSIVPLANSVLSRAEPFVEVRELVLEGRGETAQHVEMIMTRSELAGGKAGDYVLSMTFRDVTRRRLAEIEARSLAKEAVRASKAKSNFLAAVSHELRTPLNAIIGFSDMMRADRGLFLEKGDFERYAQDIHQSGTHLLSMVNDILDITRIEKGDLPIDGSHVNISDIFEETRNMLAGWPEAVGKSVTFEAQDVPRIWSDSRLIKQVVINLVSNAIKFSGQYGIIGVRASTNDRGEICLAVSDNGVGIDEQDLESITKPFFRANADLARPTEGAGLGLAIVAGIARALGGRMSINSRVGDGTTVIVSLPIRAKIQAAA